MVILCSGHCFFRENPVCDTKLINIGNEAKQREFSLRNFQAKRPMKHTVGPCLHSQISKHSYQKRGKLKFYRSYLDRLDMHVCLLFKDLG